MRARTRRDGNGSSKPMKETQRYVPVRGGTGGCIWGTGGPRFKSGRPDQEKAPLGDRSACQQPPRGLTVGSAPPVLLLETELVADRLRED